MVLAPTASEPQVRQLRISLDASMGDVNLRLDAMGGPSPLAYISAYVGGTSPIPMPFPMPNHNPITLTLEAHPQPADPIRSSD